MLTFYPTGFLSRRLSRLRVLTQVPYPPAQEMNQSPEVVFNLLLIMLRAVPFHSRITDRGDSVICFIWSVFGCSSLVLALFLKKIAPVVS